jgi:hypothetical protein
MSTITYRGQRGQGLALPGAWPRVRAWVRGFDVRCSGAKSSPSRACDPGGRHLRWFVREVRVLMPLEFLRWLPGFLTGRRPSVRIQSAPLLAGFTAGVVSRGEHWGKEVVAGAVGASGAQDSNDPLAVKSPATGLCGLGDDAAVLVDRDHESCFRTPASEPAEREIEPMASHYHRLHATSRLDVEASCRPLSEVGVEGL